MFPNEPLSVIPAHLSFLTIFNPSLGKTDETLDDQILFYYNAESGSAHPTGSAHRDNENNRQTYEDDNEKLRQIGLAQGMVSFAKWVLNNLDVAVNFSNGAAVNSVDTERSRIVMHELEPDWWILASINLTRVATAHRPSAGTKGPRIEYSSRELAPPCLLTQQLLRAHSTFLLNQGPSLSILLDRLTRTKFCNILERFWIKFLRDWNIFLHGNPAVDIFLGIKLAAGGELGIGVGEEDWGSGEREVLEDFISRTDGLVDIVVSRFGDPPLETDSTHPTQKGGGKAVSEGNHDWIGHDTLLGPHDGVIFSGIGAISRKSVTRVSQWMEWIHRYGEDAYGVRDDPKSIRRKKRKVLGKPRDRKQISRAAFQGPSSDQVASPRIPPPLIIPTDSSKPKPDLAKASSGTSNPSDNVSPNPAMYGTDTFMKLITLGYGTSWGASTTKPPSSHPRVDILRQDGSGQDSDSQQSSTSVSKSSKFASSEQGRILPRLDETCGRFIIGLRDDLDNDETDDESQEGGEQDLKTQDGLKQSKKILVRTIDVNMNSSERSADACCTNSSVRLQVVVYLYQPFMFTFLFEPETAALSSTAFYRSIHYQLGPLQTPLLSSTSLSKVAERLSQYECRQVPTSSSSSPQGHELYDVIYDPTHQTIRTSLPNIPEPLHFPNQQRSNSMSKAADQRSQTWSRVDALNVYMHILNIYSESRYLPMEIERTCKTNRGWWVLWMRLPSSTLESQQHATSCLEGDEKSPPPPKEAFLVRKSSDRAGTAGTTGHLRSTSGKGFFRNMGRASAGSSEGWAITPSKLVEGVGLDAKKYIDALLNLNQ
ncbi:hypothetical protein FQN57_005851 [Myotisia sp. PD_48]|nr:hypothetical protein FQN57_005851 [Myotisia sp. PD_48]